MTMWHCPYCRGEVSVQTAALSSDSEKHGQLSAEEWPIFRSQEARETPEIKLQYNIIYGGDCVAGYEKIDVFKKMMYFPLEPVREFFFFLILGKCEAKGKQMKCWEHTNSSLNHFEKQEYVRADEFINVEQQSCWWCLS